MNNVHIGVGAQASQNARSQGGAGPRRATCSAPAGRVKPPFVRVRVEVDDQVVADFATRS